jgi:hypothetical protein
MRNLLLLCGALVLTATTHAAYVPTPDSAMTFKMGEDARPWTMVFQNGDRSRIIAEFTIAREDIEHWSEMVAQQIDSGKLPLDAHFKNWVAMLERADPKIVITQQKLGDGSVLATYDSAAFDELSVRRFIKGTDGIYMLAYHVRHRRKKPEIWELWTKIVSNASLLPNPFKK